MQVVAYLISWPNDKDSTQDKSFTFNVSPEAPPEGPPDVPPHPNTQEHREAHPPQLGAVEISLRRQYISSFCYITLLLLIALSHMEEHRPSDPRKPSQKRTS